MRRAILKILRKILLTALECETCGGKDYSWRGLRIGHSTGKLFRMGLKTTQLIDGGWECEIYFVPAFETGAACGALSKNDEFREAVT